MDGSSGVVQRVGGYVATGRKTSVEGVKIEAKAGRQKHEERDKI